MTKNLILLAGAAALVSAAPALAKPGKGHGHDGNPHVTGQYYAPGLGACPPGLAKKGCMPPGQAKRLYRVGQRLPLGYGTRYGFNQIPYDLRTQYGLSPYGNYYYGDGYLYGVDPKTMVISQVVSALLR
ncbi:MAG TPA: hypothetical protein VJ597_03220 [Sphingomicrobium sp.]|nr:hypothetical protein [Sphingomicrobium sp.]